ncbi:hypothetical protein [Oryza sativa Japonica Group]|uniref:Uncharacterized protein n=1 Tax=Oryza sativa subsp. japonica TaxID=39947 RepID=Q8S1A6_ORYSJ|nr:hypothetical protein [Oryza sativa Japonica Group]
MEGHVGGRWWPGCAAAALQLQATATHAGERVAPRHRQRPRLPRPVAPPPDHRAAAAVLVLVVPDAATLAEDDRLRPQRGASLVGGGGRVTACVLVVIVIVVVPPPPRRPYPRPEPLREAHVLRRQAPPRRERVGRRERRRDRAVRPDVDDRDGDSRSLRRRRRRLSLADTAVGLGSDVARRRGHLGCRRGSGGGGGGGGGGGLGGGASHAATAALIPWRGTAPCRGRGAALAPGSLGRRRGGGQRLAGVGDAEREADGDEGRDPRGVEDRGRRDGEPAEEVALVVERGGGGRVRYRRRRHHWYRERERERERESAAGGDRRRRTLEYVATCVHGLVCPIHAATARSLAACVLPYVAVWNARALRSIGPGRQCVAGRGKSPTVPTRDWSSKFQLPSSCQILEVAVIAAGTQIWAKPLTSPAAAGARGSKRPRRRAGGEAATRRRLGGSSGVDGRGSHEGLEEGEEHDQFVLQGLAAAAVPDATTRPTVVAAVAAFLESSSFPCALTTLQSEAKLELRRYGSCCALPFSARREMRRFRTRRREMGERERERMEKKEEEEGNRNDMWAIHVSGSHIILVRMTNGPSTYFFNSRTQTPRQLHMDRKLSQHHHVGAMLAKPPSKTIKRVRLYRF